MKEIINILICRDGLTRNEAENILVECMNTLRGAIYRGNYTEAEDIVADYLGLEPDYLDILLNYMM